MEAASPENAASGEARSVRIARLRARRDRLATRLIGLGGLTVIVAIVLIFFYLAYIVAPLFQPARATLRAEAPAPGDANQPPLFLSIEEQLEVVVRITADGLIRFSRLADGVPVEAAGNSQWSPGGLLLVEEAIEHNGLLAAAAEDGRVYLVRHDYEARYDGGVANRTIVPRIGFPYGQSPVMEIGDSEVAELALSESGNSLALAALDRAGMLHAWTGDRIENLLSGDVSLSGNVRRAGPFNGVTALALSGDHRALYLGYDDGRVQRLKLPNLEPAGEVGGQAAPVTAMTMLLGGISLLVGDAEGGITQMFPVPDAGGENMLRPIRRFSAGTAAIERIAVEPRRKGFAALDADQNLTLYHSTSERQLLHRSVAGLAPRSLSFSPRADALLMEGEDGALHLFSLDNDHPEVSFSSLWKKVWYENYDEPAHVWQSSAATRDFEPKFSLTPLLFGTVKAALYAMLFAIPLALMGAAYTACFMAPRLRRWVKPGIEVMAALPTVILGFLAGLWFAPFIERHLAGLFALLVVVPAGMLGFAWAWHRYGGRFAARIPAGFEPLVQIPALAVCVLLAFAVAEPMQYVFFGQDLSSWLTQVAGIEYDQRNALVVGCAMGFAIVPTIFTIAEDAMSGVPASLSNGSLALGATPWQTLLLVVLPTASPGIFSALMIGFGRAVGETMIVLMATGNTPIMDWNVFEGMRTLAANIAVEMPESEVHSTHYRILFLAALVLFVFTFAVNTVADVVRQSLRQRYGAL
ncbi:ABC transporter permease subunit [Elongatibacter sediminis]|uniref:ABC transporter permease subunit n=1 Tax=Elongatibacter sediminis TaxID=3119006 RepID=A0AAW9RK14_9GAMM